jgi:hypothetical protein
MVKKLEGNFFLFPLASPFAKNPQISVERPQTAAKNPTTRTTPSAGHFSDGKSNEITGFARQRKTRKIFEKQYWIFLRMEIFAFALHLFFPQRQRRFFRWFSTQRKNPGTNTPTHGQKGGRCWRVKCCYFYTDSLSHDHLSHIIWDFYSTKSVAHGQHGGGQLGREGFRWRDERWGLDVCGLGWHIAQLDVTTWMMIEKGMQARVANGNHLGMRILPISTFLKKVLSGFKNLFWYWWPKIFEFEFFNPKAQKQFKTVFFWQICKKNLKGQNNGDRSV